MRKGLKERNPATIPMYEWFNKINKFFVEKVIPVMVIIFLVLIWLDIFKIPLKN